MDSVHPDDRALSASRLRQMTEQATPTPLIEYRFLKLDGTVIDVQTHGVPVIFDGEPSLCTTMRDVTGRNRADEIRRIGAIAFDCQEGMVVMNQHWQVLQVNRAFTALTGLSRADFRDLPFELPPCGPRVEGLAQRVRDGLDHDGGWIGEVWTSGRDRGQLLLRASFKAVRDESGQTTHIIGAFIDLTGSHMLQEQRIADEKQLRQALVLEVHHRVKNNLQGINGLLNELAHAHPEVAAPVQHMIGQLQGVSVIYGLQGRASSIEIRLCELALAIAQEVQSLWRTPIAVDIPADWRACIVAEEEAVPMALVLNELLVNAVKHGGREHGWVRVCFRRSAVPSWIRIEIVNPKATFVLTEPPGYGHAGLDLVAALLPRQGARHFRESRGDQVVTVLDLGPAVFEMSAQTLPAPAPLIID
jgi:PAS domain S-box-containing protein